MALGPPTPPGTPAGGPAVPPAPNILLFEFDTPRPGTYRLRVACGDALVAVSNQQIQVFDGTVLLATLFTGASAPANSFIDAQGNVLTAANWPGLNASTAFIFQTTQVVFAIGDGVNHTYVSSLQVQDAVGLQTVLVPLRRRLRQFRRRQRLLKRQLFPFQPPAPYSNLVMSQPLRLHKPRPRRLLRVRRPRKLYPSPVFLPSIVVREPPLRRRTWPRRKPLRVKHRQVLPRIIPPPPPLVLPYKPLRHPHWQRRRRLTVRRRYPYLAIIHASVENPNPTAKIVVVVT